MCLLAKNTHSFSFLAIFGQENLNWPTFGQNDVDLIFEINVKNDDFAKNRKNGTQ